MVGSFGLSGAIFTADIGRAKALASRIETGSVWINALVHCSRAYIRRHKAVRRYGHFPNSASGNL